MKTLVDLIFYLSYICCGRRLHVTIKSYANTTGFAKSIVWVRVVLDMLREKCYNMHPQKHECQYTTLVQLMFICCQVNIFVLTL